LKENNSKKCTLLVLPVATGVVAAVIVVVVVFVVRCNQGKVARKQQQQPLGSSLEQAHAKYARHYI
jgi:flagellar basal body-associated protein FliL